jgi:lipoprotein-anchoring transpeptidase ErfK/SrfK
MKIKILAFLFSFISVILIFAGVFNYLRSFKQETKIEFDRNRKEIILSFKYPIPRSYFLRNFEILPKVQGQLIFEESLNPSLEFLGYKKIKFLPEKLEHDTPYKVKVFEKELSFELPSPKPKEIIFDEKEGIIKISFFEPIEKDYFFEKLKIEPRLEGDFSFSEDNKEIVFRPKYLQKDKEYFVEILGKSINFKIESPKIKEIYFDQNKKEVIMTFQKPIEKDYFFENFKISPHLEGEYTFEGEKVVFIPKRIEEGKNYRIEILGKSFDFEIPKPPPKQESKPISKPRPKPQVSQTSQDKLIEVDLSEQILRLHQGGKVIATYVISSGKPETPTPTGTFKIQDKKRLAWSASYGVFLPYALKLYNGYYIHELPYWPGGYREGEEDLGKPVSHGCVRLGIGPAENVYNFADIGTKVIIHE